MDRGALALQVNEGSPKLVHLPDPPADGEPELAHGRRDARRRRRARRSTGERRVSGVEASEWRVRFHAEATRKQRVQQMIAIGAAGQRGDGGRGRRPRGRRAGRDASRARQGPAVRRAPRATRRLSIPIGRREHMVRDFAPLAARKLDVRMYAQWTQEDDWTVRLPPGAKVKSAPVVGAGLEPLRVVRGRRDRGRDHAPREDDRHAREDARDGGRVRGVPRVVRAGRPRAGPARHGGAQMKAGVRCRRSASLATASALGCRRVGAPSPAATSRRSPTCARPARTSSDAELVGRWALAEELSPGRHRRAGGRGAQAARRRVADRTGHVGGSRARRRRRGARRSALGRRRLHRRARRARAADPEPQAPLVAWFAARQLLSLRGSVAGLFAQHRRHARRAARSARARRLARGRRARGLARDGGLRQRRARRRTLTTTRSCAAWAARGASASPARSGTGAAADPARSFDAEKPGPWPPAWAPDAMRGTTPHVLSVSQTRCLARGRRAGARGRVLRGVVLHDARRPRAHRRGAGRRGGVGRRRSRCSSRSPRSGARGSASARTSVGVRRAAPRRRARR